MSGVNSTVFDGATIFAIVFVFGSICGGAALVTVFFATEEIRHTKIRTGANLVNGTAFPSSSEVGTSESGCLNVDGGGCSQG